MAVSLSVAAARLMRLSQWLTFSIIINLLPDSSKIYLFGTPEITAWVNLAAQWVCECSPPLYTSCTEKHAGIDAGNLLLSFVIALGNRPKSEVGLYTLGFFINAVMGYYLLVAALFLTIRAFMVSLSPTMPKSGLTFFRLPT